MSKYGFYKEASLSQKLAFERPLYQKLAGTDREISDSIAILYLLTKKGLMKKKESEFVLDLLDALRMSAFATSNINEVTKLGLQLPKSENIISKF